MGRNVTLTNCLPTEFGAPDNDATATTMAHRLAGNRRRIHLLPALLLAFLGAATAAAQTQITTGEGIAQLEAKQQRHEGQIYYADGDVEIHYKDMVLKADHVEFNGTTYQAVARDHVHFEYNSMQLEADRAELNIRTGKGHFEHVHGAAHIERQPNPSILVTPNPLSFQAESVDRLDENTYHIVHAWLTVCDPDKPAWTFAATQATLHVDRDVALVSANFRLFRIPLIYLPYATLPAGRRVRQSGFLTPQIGSSGAKGLMLGDSYYWAPADWADATIGAELLSRRGWSQTAKLQLRPSENIDLSGAYSGVVDRLGQGGHTLNFRMNAQFADGWHAVADVNQLTSLTYLLAFAPTFSEAVNSEVHNNGFLTNNFDGFSINFAASSYKNFLTAQPATAVVLRKAPEARFHAVDQEPWKRWPVYFGVDVWADAAHRSDTEISTPSMVQRSEFAPRATVPLALGHWLNVTSTFTFRTTRYGAQMLDGAVVDDPVTRNTEEAQVDLRPAALERIWGSSDSKWKHTIEPEVVYRYVTGVNQFGTFLRFDENDTLTDTNEVEYSITQRLFHRKGTASSAELLSWRIVQKYYLDPTFGGAIVAGQRNVFQALDSLTPFAFADGPRRFSPIVSDLKFSPGGRYDAEVRTDYDTLRHRITAQSLLLNMRIHKDLKFTLAQYAVNATPILQPPSDQIRFSVSYGELNRRGWNGALGVGYDIRQGFAQNQVAQISYNGSCCGIAFEYRRLALGPVVRGNEYHLALIIANLGMFGNLSRREVIF